MVPKRKRPPGQAPEMCARSPHDRTNIQTDAKTTTQHVTTQTGQIKRPGGMREAIRRPSFAGHGVLDSSSSCLCLSWSFWLGFARSGQVLLDLFPLLNPPRPVPTFRQAYHFRALLSHFFRIFFWTSFFIDFCSVLASILAPKIDPKPEKIGKDGYSNPTLFSYRFFDRF